MMVWPNDHLQQHQTHSGLHQWQRTKHLLGARNCIFTFGKQTHISNDLINNRNSNHASETPGSSVELVSSVLMMKKLTSTAISRCFWHCWKLFYIILATFESNLHNKTTRQQEQRHALLGCLTWICWVIVLSSLRECQGALQLCKVIYIIIYLTCFD